MILCGGVSRRGRPGHRLLEDAFSSISWGFKQKSPKIIPSFELRRQILDPPLLCQGLTLEGTNEARASPTFIMKKINIVKYSVSLVSAF